MQIISGSADFPQALQGSVLTMGNFDGVHIGHQAIIRRLLSAAQQLKAPAVAYTFDPHPAKVLAPSYDLPMIQTLGQRLRTLAANGLDATVVEQFTPAFAAQEPDHFFESVILSRLAPCHMIVGYDLTFGRHRAGRVTDLQALCTRHGIGCDIIQPVFAEEILISSSYIRQSIAHGHFADAEAALGRPFAIEGQVVTGQGIGRTLGFPTLNLVPENELMPPPGVYITSATLPPSETVLPAATYIGNKPTFGGTTRVVETYILEGDVHQPTRMEIAFHKHLRGDVQFENPKALKQQIAKDVDQARAFHKKSSP